MFWLSKVWSCEIRISHILRSKGKTMVVTLSDDEVSDHESGSDEDGNFIAFTATTVIDESVVAIENPFNVELFEINPNLPRRCNFYWFDNLIYGRLRRRNKVCGMSLRNNDAIFKT